MANTKRTRQTAPKGTMKKVLNYVGRHGFFIAVSMILAVVIVALTLYAPILIGNAIDEIAGKDNVDFSNVAQILMKTAVVIGITAVLQWVMNAINNRITYHVVRDIRNAAFRHIEVLPLSYIDANPYGDIVNRVIADADQFSEGLLMGFTQLFTGVATIVGALIFMFTISWPIAVVVVVATPLSLFVAKFIASRTYRMFRLQTETRGKQTAFIDEMIGSQKVVQTFSHEEKSLRDFDVINDRLAEYSLKATFYSSLSNPSTRFVNSVIYAGVALCGALMCISSAGTAAAFTIGQLSCCLSYTNQYTKPFNEISGVITELQNSLACAARLFELIEEKPQVEEPADAVKLTNVKGSVELDNVSFSYVPDRKLIEDLSLTVKPGQRVAIVGPTGCGKTTIINLLMRFYDVNGGSVSVEGSDIRNVTRNYPRQYRHGHAGRHRRGGNRRRQGFPRAQLHQENAAGIRHGHRRGRRKPFPGSEAAALHYARNALPAAYAYPGRGYFLYRYANRDQDSGLLREDDEGQNELHRCSPPFHYPRGGCYPRNEGWPHHRAGKSRAAARPERILREPLQQPVRGVI